MDANIFNKLKGIDEWCKKIVYGFVNRHDKNVPDLVTSLCLVYFFETEEFGNHGKHIEIKYKNGIRYGALSALEWDYNTVFGSTQINPKQTPQSTFKWTFEMDDFSEFESAVAIGFTESNQLNLNTYAFNMKNPFCYYVWDLAQRSKWDHQELAARTARSEKEMPEFYPFVEIKGKQVIKITFNVPKRTIEAQLNDINLGLLFENVDTTKSYYLGVSLLSNVHTFKIKEFCITNRGATAARAHFRY